MCKNKKAPHLTSDNISNFFISAHEKHNRILPYIILATLALLFICLPVIPITGFFPSRDAGVFLYIGNSIIDGETPYRDLWDHKGPLIFWIYALGLKLGSGTIWGPWLLQIANTIASTFLCHMILKRRYSPTVAIAATSTMVLAIVPTGLEFDLTEAYALTFQLLAILSLEKIIYRPSGFLWQSILGISGAAAFLLKPNMVGAWLCIFLYLYIFIIKNKLNKNIILIAALSGLFAITGVIIHLWTNNALYDAYVAIWQFNREYASTDTNQRLYAAWQLMKTSSKTGFSTFAALGLFAAILKWRKQSPLVKICCFIFPVEIFLASLSGRPYAHYYIPLLSSGTILTANIINDILNKFKKSNWPISFKKEAATIGLVMLFFIQIYVAQKIALQNFKSHDSSRTEAVDWIKKSIAPNKKILILGAEAGSYFVAKRSNPCRFIYHYPILQSWSKQEDFAKEFEACYFSENPDYIIDAMQTDQDANTLFIKDQKDDPQHPKILNFIWDDLNKKYILIHIIEGTSWRVYKRAT